MALSSRGPWLTAVTAIAVVAGACRTPAVSPPTKRDALAAPSASAPASAPLASAHSVPLLVVEPLGPEAGPYQSLHPVEGALLVAEGRRVGRLVDGKITWLDTMVPTRGASESDYDNTVLDVRGRWPDAVDVVYAVMGGRGPLSPTYFPLTGKGIRHTFDPNGGGKFSGLATVGKSTVVSGFSVGAGHELLTVRGPRLALRHLSEVEVGCTAEERTTPAPSPSPSPRSPAIEPQVFGATAAGTAMSVGEICARRAPGAEVWDKTGKSKIVDLGRWFSRPFRADAILIGRDDEAWIIPGGWSRIVRYRDGAFDAVPDLERPIVNTFVGAHGALHASDGEVIYRLERDTWTPVARLAVPARPISMAMDDRGNMWSVSSDSPVPRVVRLRERGLAVVAQAPACTTPFVFLYELPFRDANVRFPATRKSLAGFPGASHIELVELLDYGARHLGARVASRAQGDALVAHLRQTMKDIDPRFLCFDSRAGQKVDLARGPGDRMRDGD